MTRQEALLPGTCFKFAKINIVAVPHTVFLSFLTTEVNHLTLLWYHMQLLNLIKTLQFLVQLQCNYQCRLKAQKWNMQLTEACELGGTGPKYLHGLGKLVVCLLEWTLECTLSGCGCFPLLDVLFQFEVPVGNLEIVVCKPRN